LEQDWKEVLATIWIHTEGIPEEQQYISQDFSVFLSVVFSLPTFQ
jgi:hypothetical protein